MTPTPALTDAYLSDLAAIGADITNVRALVAEVRRLRAMGAEIDRLRAMLEVAYVRELWGDEWLDHVPAYVVDRSGA